MTINLNHALRCTATFFLLSGLPLLAYSGDLNPSPSLLLNNISGESVQWSGIGKIFIDNKPHCTASLIDTRTTGGESNGPAYILTAGHCAVNRADNTFADVPYENGKGTIAFNYFNDTPNQYKFYKISTVRWSTLRGSDVAVLELDTPLAALINEGIEPLKISQSPVTSSEKIRIVGAPEGIPEKGLRMATCRQEPVGGSLVEQLSTFYPGTLKNQCNDIRKGSSGSPVFDQNTRQIKSVMFTSTYGSTIDKQCRTDSPCEVIDGQPQWFENTHYSQTVDHLNACFINGTFDIQSEACTLKTGPEFEDLTRIRIYSRINVNAEDQPIYPTWKLAFALSTENYRYKLVHDATDCKDPNYYSHAISTNGARIDDIIGKTPGIRMLCILGVESADELPTEKLMGSAIVIASRIAEPGPTPLPRLEFSIDNNGTHQVKWLNSAPDSFLSYYLVGTPETIDCNTNDIPRYISGGGDHQGNYVMANEKVEFSAEQLPVKICSYTRDESSQASAVREDILQ
ncbi:trypsin-like serine peptidase [Pseudomonas sp. LB1P83]